ncbi:MAG TPA: helix-turn-helix domain-containing protein [Candidatus Limnocylindrales bacterium]
MRADAQRNRARLLAVAEEVFTTKGTTASTEEVARAAGVGIGTLFRHFPTKEALLEAVLVGRLERIVAEADSLSQVDDPGEAFHTFFARVVGESGTKKALADALAAAGVDVGRATRQSGKDLARALHKLLGRAQGSGAIRDDLGVPDLVALLVGASRAVEQLGADPDAQRRVISVVLNGLRPSPPGGVTAT